MTTRAEATQDLNSKFVTAWGGSTPQTKYTFDNVDLDSAVEWTRVTIDGGFSRQRTFAPIGQRTYDRRATLVVEIHVAKNGGTARADALGDIIEEAFESQRVGGCNTFAVHRAHKGTYLGRWHKMEVRVPFAYYHRK